MPHTTRSISNTDDILDSRDVIARIGELESWEAEYNDGADGPDATFAERVTPFAEAFPEEAAELATLRALAAEGESVAADWSYGETLIRDSYFREYAEELAADCAPSPELAAFLRGEGLEYQPDPYSKKTVSLGWPFTFVTIDWDAAAEALKADYSAIDFGGVTYWTR